MPATSTETLLNNLAESNLLSDEQLAHFRAEAEQPSGEVSAGQLAESLVQREWLTSWQAGMLLSGRHAFFLGKYKLLDHLGSGGMGSVFKAEQAPLGRIVAVKVMAKKLVDDETAVARFRREIRAAAALNHPNIVTALDAESVGQTHFLVMEYVEGKDLGSIVKGEKRLHLGKPASTSGRWHWDCSTPMSAAWSTATSSRAICC